MALRPSQVPVSVRDVISGAGQPLDAQFRTQAEARLGLDFSPVRVHADSAASASAQQIGAAAYTVGNHIVFGQGRFPPATAAGMRLVNHELTHVAQQGVSVPAAGLVLGDERDPAEAEADEIASDITGSSGRKTRPGGAGTIRRQPLAPGQPPTAERRTQPPPDATVWDRFWSQGRMLSRMFTENRYGCWCGPGNVCQEVRDPIDACCKAHDEGYARVKVSSEPKGDEVDMWSADGYVRTMEIDRTLVDCTQTAQAKDKRLGTAQLYVEGVSLIFGTRASIAQGISALQAVGSVAKTAGSVAGSVGKAAGSVATQLFVRPVLVARASVDPTNWDVSAMPERSGADLVAVGLYLWSKLHPEDPNDFSARIAQPLSSYAIPHSLLESIAHGASAAASRATGFAIQLRVQDLESLSPYVFVQTMHDWKALRYRVDPQATADAMLASPKQ